MAKGATSAASPASSGPPAWITWTVLALGFAGAFVAMPAAALLLAAGLSPSLVAAFVDQSSGRARTHAMTITNLAGLVPALKTLWRHGGGLEMVGVILHDVFAWLGIFGAAAGALVLLWIGPHLAVSYLSLKRRHAAGEVERAQNALRREWGPAVAGSDPLQE